MLTGPRLISTVDSKHASDTAQVVLEKVGKFDSKAFAQTAHGLTITPQQEPNILMEVTWDKNGDIDRQSFLGEVVNGKQKIVEVLPKLGM